MSEVLRTQKTREYERDGLLDDDDHHFPTDYSFSKFAMGLRKGSITYIFIFLILLGMIISLIGVSTLGRKQPIPANRQWMDCGHTAEEARARNCHYEAMQRSWIPDACYFTEPSHEYNPFRDRQWFMDEYLKIPATSEVLDRLESGDEKLAFAEYFHDEHCVYAWRKLHLAVQMRKPYIDSKTLDMHHTTHCAKRIADVLHHSENSTMDHYMGGVTESPLMFQTCIALPWKEL